MMFQQRGSGSESFYWHANALRTLNAAMRPPQQAMHMVPGLNWGVKARSGARVQSGKTNGKAHWEQAAKTHGTCRPEVVDQRAKSNIQWDRSPKYIVMSTLNVFAA
jgi:hypothetical protein